MKRPTCSIVIPSRNCLKYLSTTLASVELQDRDDLEVVVADDGSTDGTADWLRSRNSRGFSLRVLETGGIGPASARNAAVAAAGADLVAFLDADDVWWPQKLDRQIAYHRTHPVTAFSFTDYIHVTPDGRTLGTCFEYWNETWVRRDDGSYAALPDAESRLLACNLVGTSTVVVSRAAFEAAGGFSASCRSAEDWDLWLRLASGAPVAFSSAVTMSYLMRPGSETSGRGRRLETMREIIARYERRPEPAFRSAVREARARAAIAEAEMAREEGRMLRAARSHLRALAQMPSWRTSRALAADVVAATLRRRAAAA